MIGSAEQNASKSLIDPITQRVKDYQQSTPKLQQAIQEDLTDDTLSADTLARLGLSAGTKIYDTNLNNYLTLDQTQANEDLLATKDERTKYAALMSLIGQDPTLIGNEDKQLNPVSFNKEKFDSDVAQKDSEYKKAYTTQRGTVAAASPFGTPWDGFGAVTERGGSVSNATPEEIENYWIPVFAADGAAYGYGNRLADALQAQLDNWKNTYQNSRQIKAGK